MSSDGIRRRAGAVMVDNFFRGLAAAGKLHPRARPARHDVEVVRNLAYLDDGDPDHRLDQYRPTHRSGPFPTVLYIHGGGFRILSKDTHWMMALSFARRGYQVFNINYRLAPQSPFPAAIADSCAAFLWLVKNAAAYDIDLSRLILAGESAGANLVTSLALACAYRRDEPWARAVFDTGVMPRAVLPACGIFQVSDVERFWRRRPKIPLFIRDRLAEVRDSYFRGVTAARGGELELADPLLLLERGEKPERALPPFFLPVGTADPLLDDTRRLKAALDRLGVRAEARYYEGEPHAFHALVFRANARRCWEHLFAFVDEALR